MFIIPVNEGSPVALPALRASPGAALRIAVVGVPEEAESVTLTLSGSCTDASTTELAAEPGGEWRGFLPATAFLSSGNGGYAIVADIGGNSVSLGAGAVFVD